MKSMMRSEKIGRVSFTVLLMLVLFLIEADFGYGYFIDGNLDDWGITLSATTDFDTDLPLGGLDIDFITEDNADNSSGWQYVSPGYTYDGNYFDVEAIYFDNDQTYAYIAIVQGLPITGGTAPNNPWFLPGDIAIDTPGGDLYEYGIDIADETHNPLGILYIVDDWNDVVYFPSSNPWEINTVGNSGTGVSFVYSGEQYTHYVLEAAIPLSSLGLNANDSLSIHWTQECGNDNLTLVADVNPVPEPSTLLLLGSGLIGAGLLGLRRKKK
jgi:hypothetical protein